MTTEPPSEIKVSTKIDLGLIGSEEVTLVKYLTWFGLCILLGLFLASTGLLMWGW